MKNYLRAQILGTSCITFIMFAQFILHGLIGDMITATMQNPAMLTPSLIFLLSSLAFMAFVGLVAWPFAALTHTILRMSGYTKLWEYALAGLIGGLLIAMLTQGFMVGNAPETNHYQPLYGWALAKLYLSYYIQLSVVGLVYAVSYWQILVQPKPAHRRPSQKGQ